MIILNVEEEIHHVREDPAWEAMGRAAVF